MADNPNFDELKARPNIADLAESDPLSTQDIYDLQHPSVPTPPAPSADLQAYMQQLYPTPINTQNQGALLPGMKPGSLGDMWNTVQFRGMDVPQDVFFQGKRQMADFRNPKLSNQFYDRYAEHPDFDELGFSPFRNNEELYNEHASWWNDMQRAVGQWATLAGLGFKDAFSFGDITDTKTAAKFERAMAIGASSKGGVGGFTTNLFLNSGYTMGIMGELVVEEAAMLLAEAGLALAAPVTGGTSVAGNVAIGARMATKAVSVGKKLEDAYKMGKGMFKTLDNLKDVSKAKKYFKSAMNAAGDFINPLENTTQYFRSLNSMKDLGKLVQTSQGFASFYKDIRNVRLAFGEASLEGGMVQNEMTDSLYEAFVAENDRQPNKEESIAIREKAIQAGQTTTLMNVPAIYFSDKLMFDGLVRGRFKRLYTGKVTLPKSGGEAFLSFKNKVPVLEDVAQGMWNRTKQYARNPKLAFTKAGAYFKANVTEGIQETLQDIISNTNKQYYLDEFTGDPVRGGYLNYMASALDKQVSAQGVETFLSGFLMGGLVSPISSGITAAMHGKQGLKDTWVVKAGGTINDQMLRMKWRNDPGKYAKYREDIKEEKAKTTQKRLDDINLLNDYFQDPTKYFSPELHNLVAQKKYAEAMVTAAKDGNRYDYQDAKDAAGYEAIKAAYQMGHIDTSIQRMEEMKNMEETDIQEAYGMSKPEFDAIIDSSIQRAKSIEKRYNEAAENKSLRNPFNPNKYKDPYKKAEETYGWKAWNDAIDDLVFGQFSFDRALERRNQLLDEFKKVTKLNKVSFSEFIPLQNLTETNNALIELDKEIKLLTPEGNKVTEESAKKLLNEKRLKRVLLKKFQVVAKQGNIEINSDGKISKETYTKLRKAYGQYLNFLTDQNYDFVTDDAIDTSLTQLVDSYMLDARAIAANQHVNTLLDPKAFRQKFEDYRQVVENLHKNRKFELTAALAAFDAGISGNEVFKKLKELGIFVNPKDFKKMMISGTMPRHLYNIQNVKDDNDEVAVTSEQYYKAVGIFREYLKARGLTLNQIAIFDAQSDPYASQVRTKDPNDKREYEDFATQFNFNPEEERSSVSLKEVLQAVINSKYSTPYDIALAEELLKKATDNQSVTFTRNSKVPNYYVDSEQSVVDPRYCSVGYEMKDGISYPIEFLILKNEIQRQISEGIRTDSEFKDTLNILMTEAIDAWKLLSETEQKKIVSNPSQPFKGFNSIYQFATEAMTNEYFQNFLAKVQSKTTIEGKSVWKKFIDAVLDRIKNVLTIKKKLSGTVLNATLDLISAKIGNIETQTKAEANTPIQQTTSSTITTVKPKTATATIPGETILTTDIEDGKDALREIRKENRGKALEEISIEREINKKVNKAWEAAVNLNFDLLMSRVNTAVNKNKTSVLATLETNTANAIQAELRANGIIINNNTKLTYIQKYLKAIKEKYDAEEAALENEPVVETEEDIESEKDRSPYPLVSDTEIEEFNKTGIPTPARVVIITNKLRKNWPLTIREKQILKSLETEEAVKELNRKLDQPYRKGIGDKENKALKELGYIKGEITNAKQAHEIIQEGLRKEERAMFLVKQKPIISVKSPEQYQNEVHQRFLDISKNPNATADDIERVKDWAANLPVEYIINGKVSAEMIDQWKKEAYTQLALALNFEQLKLNTIVKLARDNSKGDVIKVTKSMVIIKSRRDGKEYRVTPTSMKNDIKYIVTEALLKAELPSEKEVVETTPDDKEKIDESIKVQKDLNSPDEIKADIEKGRNTSMEDLLKEFNAKKCKGKNI